MIAIDKKDESTSHSLDYEPLRDKWHKDLCTLFRELNTNGDDRFFHPHPLTDDEAKDRIEYTGKDLYFLQIIDGALCGYGFLRGWDEGYEIPSLGIAIHPNYRGQGLGVDFINFLHIKAREHGANTVRLTVSRANTNAISLYNTMGYKFQNKGTTNLVGFFEL